MPESLYSAYGRKRRDRENSICSAASLTAFASRRNLDSRPPRSPGEPDLGERAPLYQASADRSQEAPQLLAGVHETGRTVGVRGDLPVQDLPVLHARGRPRGNRGAAPAACRS